MLKQSPVIGIRSLRIRNFRAIDSLNLEFLSPNPALPSNIAVFAGPNGSGKTSILEACLIGLGYEGRLHGNRGPTDSHTGLTDIMIELDIQTPSGLFRSTTNSHGKTEWTNRATGSIIEKVVVPTIYFSSWRAPKLVGSLDITAGKPGKRPADTQGNRVWRVKQSLVNAKAHMMMSTPQPSLFKDQIDELNEVWSTFYPRSEGKFLVEGVSQHDPNAGFDVFFQDRNGQKVSVDAFSSGQLELFALFGTLLTTQFREGIVVIDEPELHLDPQWHALMLRAIRQSLPEAQFIVATHSPKIFDSVMSFQRHLLVAKNDPRADGWVSRMPETAGV